MQRKVRLTGFGMVVTPEAPFRLDQSENGPPTTMRVAGPRGDALLDLAALLAEPEVDSQVSVTAGGDSGADWWIVSDAFRCRWPAGFALSSDPEGRSPFILLGPLEMMVWLDGPHPRKLATPIENLVAPGQVLRSVAAAEGAARLDLDYDHEGEPWWQRRYAIDWGRDQILIVSGQSRAAHEDVVCAALELIEQTLEPGPGDGT